jgi:hypothetical protein
MRQSILLFLLMVCFSAFSFAEEVIDFYKPVDQPERSISGRFFSQFAAGERIFESPQQIAVSEYLWNQKGSYQLAHTDEFQIKALVISKRHYLGDERADIAPFDFVVGWQKMSDPAILKNIAVRQNNRFYYWNVREFPLPRNQIELMSTNMHLIPDNPEIFEKLNRIERGQKVEMSGFLVDVKSEDGFIWATSRVRHDSGDGACEIMLVKHVDIID